MGINEIIIYLMVLFMIIGAIDKCLNNKFGLGDKFDEGIMAMGSLTLAMVGIIVIAPVLANVLSPIIVPVFSVLGADPAMFAGSLLAIDMGGFTLAEELAINSDAAMYSGVILASMLGATVVFTLPVALGIIEKDDQRFLATGVLAGVVTVPLGAIVGGIVAGFSLPMVVMNLIPIFILVVLIVLGLWKAPEKMVKGFTVFGYGVVIVATIGLAVGIIETLTGIAVIPGTGSLMEGIEIVGSIAIVLAGAFVMVEVITRVFKKPLLKLGKALGMNEIAAAGMVATLANNIPMFNMMKDMDERGKIINVAFAVSASFVLGDHLGFVAGVARDMIFPMIVGKMVGGITAIFVAMFIANKMLGKNENKAAKKAS
ncbi:ethanolamine utilization protein EutH [Pontibacillus litoralis]|uniref:Ethanolamine utilization protein EutH n=1 Tax=Pontibacillus litoralis JSM 072002 TaxID=1385512 RepID=A0A0A5FXI8_9BACI|nr:ethanolamine utilization protein EutH [Pontibacillus litoralis]KGX84514.1 ethanolamine utilization protein EutH [Pontibacillus litoralis JSM 072002]